MKKTIILTLLSFLPLYAASGPDIILDDSKDIIYLSDKIEYFKDDTGKAEFNEILNAEKNGKFVRNTRQVLAFGFSDAAIWLKFNIINLSHNVPMDWYLYFEYQMTDEIEAFIPGKEGTYKKIETGNDIARDRQIFKHRKFIIPLEHANLHDEIYIKVKTLDDALEIPFYLVSTQGLLQKNERETAIHSAYFGVLFIIILYFLMIYFAVRDKIYLYYILYALGMLISQAGIHGFLFRYITPGNYYHSQILRNLGATTAIAFALLFVIQFLSLKSNFPKFTRLHYSIIILVSGSYFLRYVAGLMDQQIFALVYYVLMMATIVLGLISGIISLRVSIYARYYLASWGFFLIVALIFALRYFDIHSFVYTLYFLEGADAAQFSLLSFALARRIRLEKVSKEQIEKKAKESRMEMLRFRNEILEKNLEFARSLQIGLIPDLSRRQNMASLYMPMEEVGGDFFDIVYIDENRTGIFFADVTGHGVQAAFITAIMKSALSTSWRNPDEENKWLMNPVDAYMKINDIFQKYCQKHFISAVYGVYDKSTGVFEYVSAMHPPLIIFQRDKNDGKTEIDFQIVSPQAPLLGVLTNKEIMSEKIVSTTITIPPNGWLFLYSDGLFESIGYSYLNFNQGLDSFKDTPLYETFHNAYKTSPAEFIAVIESKLLQYLKTQAPEDDICLLLISR